MKNSQNINNKTISSFTKTSLLLIIITIIITSCSFLGGNDSYTADMVQISKKGNIVNTTKLYITPDSYRIDGISMGKEQENTPLLNMSVIGSKKENKLYICNNEKKLFFETDINEQDSIQTLKSYKNNESKKKLGTEKVNGYKCIKSEVKTTYNFMGFSTTDTLTLWENEKFEYPLRTKTENGEITELRNIKTGKISGKKFKLNSDYKKVTNIMAVMGINLAQMMQNQSSTGKEIEENTDNAAPQNIMQGFKNMMRKNTDPEDAKKAENAMSNAFNQLKQFANSQE